MGPRLKCLVSVPTSLYWVLEEPTRLIEQFFSDVLGFLGTGLHSFMYEAFTSYIIEEPFFLRRDRKGGAGFYLERRSTSCGRTLQDSHGSIVSVQFFVHFVGRSLHVVNTVVYCVPPH